VFMATPKEPTTSSTTIGTAAWAGTSGCAPGLAPPEPAARPSVRFASYPNDPECSSRITSVIPDVRLLFMVRDPIARMPSHYLHEVAALRQRRPVEQALRENPIYLDLSRYATQLERYLDHFPRHQLLVLRAEDLFRNPLPVLLQVYRFLGIDPSWRPPSPGRRDNETARRSNSRWWFAGDRPGGEGRPLPPPPPVSQGGGAHDHPTAVEGHAGRTGPPKLAAEL
jgi:hypothetical protein